MVGLVLGFLLLVGTCFLYRKRWNDARDRYRARRVERVRQRLAAQERADRSS